MKGAYIADNLVAGISACVAFAELQYVASKQAIRLSKYLLERLVGYYYVT